ncbi:Calmodulin-binding transcription activator 2 [Sesamum angolense]|uniref:Calmodulin-binding transcription activator 2 n=1 Tax=Sesamum angolense TaxID=2727404 RepID=A0AAE1W0D2_9LAMI|nr:Calmodulin-binding transcription activator 2 [Sesamum angolense]
MVDAERKEDDYDFLKEGREKTVERLQKAAARLKSMFQYAEAPAPDQDCRLLNVVSEMQETKDYDIVCLKKFNAERGWKSSLVLNIKGCAFVGD